MMEKGETALILIVDDDPMLLRMTELVLEDQGYRVALAASGQSAIDFADSTGGKVDLVVLDLRLPDMDGVTVLKSLRSRWPSMRVLPATGYAPESMVSELMQAGAVAILEKPYDPEQLADAVKRALVA
jgi:DNA-binding NtrC family response regulator